MVSLRSLAKEFSNWLIWFLISPRFFYPTVRIAILLYGCRYGISLFYVIALLVILTLLLGGANVLIFYVLSSFGGCCSLVWLLVCCFKFLSDCFVRSPYPAFWGELTFDFLCPVFALYFVHLISLP